MMHSSPALAQVTDGMERQQARRRLRRTLLLLTAALLFIEFAGVPHMRVTYTYTGRSSASRMLAAQYWGPFGGKPAQAGQYGEGCPLIVLIPLEKSLVSYAREAAIAAWQSASARL